MIRVAAELAPFSSWNNELGLQQPVPVLRQMLPANPRIFTIGSCFALEIRWKLRERGFAVYPDYGGIQLDTTRVAAGKLPKSDNFNHYDLFNIKQCLLLAEKGGHYPEEVMWRGGYEHLAPRYGFVPRYCNPFLRQVFASDLEGILGISDQICDAFASGFHQANVFIITLGLIEAWRDLASGLHINNPGGLKDLSSEQRIRLHPISFAESVDSLRKIITIIRRSRPESVIIFTVSPVFLARTFSGRSIAEAALHGKCQLRAAVEEVLNAQEGIHYFPSFEYVLFHGGHSEDGRHVQSRYVEQIVSVFAEAYLGRGEAEPAS